MTRYFVLLVMLRKAGMTSQVLDFSTLEAAQHAAQVKDN
jgi:hypothetical protein